MTRLKVVEWKRYGNHRLYVKTEAGQDVGWVDLKSSKFRLDQEDLRPEFEQALREHAVGYLIEGDEVLVSGDRRVCRPEVVADPMGMHQWDDKSTPSTQLKQLDQPWTDLALNTPGQGIRTLAKAHRDAAPFRTGVARLFNVHTDERAYRVGADGEEATARQLARLPGEWYSLHSVPVGSHGSDIDHVVIGPGGVFTINTKHHPRSTVWVAGETFQVNGRRQPYVRDSRFEVKRAMRLLTNVTGSPVSVVGVIAIVGAHEGFKVKDQPHGGMVHVVSRKQLAGWLIQQPIRLNTVEIAFIYDHARRSTTWA